MTSEPAAELQNLLKDVAARSPSFRALLEAPVATQRQRGYYHTLREIAQQPLTWEKTADQMIGYRQTLETFLAPACRDPRGSVILTGSGSSFYVGACLAAVLQKELTTTVRAVPAGALLTDPTAYLTPGRPSRVVSFARSGDSPESTGVVDLLLDTHPECEHLVLTCNPRGRLATRYAAEPRVHSIVLHETTCDQSLVMTSSFTNLILAGRYLGMLEYGSSHRRLARALSARALLILKEHCQSLAEVAGTSFPAAVFLGSGNRYAGAREGALKMLEMTAGQVTTLAESYLGLRHGLMSAIHEQTLIVGFLSSHPHTRAYEVDLIEELNRKKLGGCKVLLGENIPSNLTDGSDRVLALSDLEAVGDENLPPIDVLVAQLLSFFRCLSLGLSPDNPSPQNVISRVVEPFPIHKRSD